MLLLPEQKLKSIIDFALSVIDDTYLYRLFGDMTFGDGSYGYYENASALFVKSPDNPRLIECNMFFNKDRQSLPTIHIALNQDYPGDGQGLGFDPSIDACDPMLDDGQYFDVRSRMYSARYNIIFTSDNTFEVLVMYNVIKAFLQGNYELLELNGLSNVKFSGQDLILTDYLMPPNIYARGFAIDCLYQFDAPALDANGGVKDVYLKAHCGREIKMSSDE